jgi:hypothetical protein
MQEQKGLSLKTDGYRQYCMSFYDGIRITGIKSDNIYKFWLKEAVLSKKYPPPKNENSDPMDRVK